MKFFSRIIALLLVPCLLADPSTAAGLVTAFRLPPQTKSFTPPASYFSEQALTLTLPWVEHPLTFPNIRKIASAFARHTDASLSTQEENVHEAVVETINGVRWLNHQATNGMRSIRGMPHQRFERIIIRNKTTTALDIPFVKQNPTSWLTFWITFSGPAFWAGWVLEALTSAYYLHGVSALMAGVLATVGTGRLIKHLRYIIKRDCDLYRDVYVIVERLRPYFPRMPMMLPPMGSLVRSPESYEEDEPSELAARLRESYRDPGLNPYYLASVLGALVERKEFTAANANRIITTVLTDSRYDLAYKKVIYKSVIGVLTHRSEDWEEELRPSWVAFFNGKTGGYYPLAIQGIKSLAAKKNVPREFAIQHIRQLLERLYYITDEKADFAAVFDAMKSLSPPKSDEAMQDWEDLLCFYRSEHSEVIVKALDYFSSDPKITASFLGRLIPEIMRVKWLDIDDRKAVSQAVVKLLRLQNGPWNDELAKAWMAVFGHGHEGALVNVDSSSVLDAFVALLDWGNAPDTFISSQADFIKGYAWPYEDLISTRERIIPSINNAIQLHPPKIQNPPIIPRTNRDLEIIQDAIPPQKKSDPLSVLWRGKDHANFVVTRNSWEVLLWQKGDDREEPTLEMSWSGEGKEMGKWIITARKCERIPDIRPGSSTRSYSFDAPQGVFEDVVYDPSKGVIRYIVKPELYKKLKIYFLVKQGYPEKIDFPAREGGLGYTIEPGTPNPKTPPSEPLPPVIKMAADYDIQWGGKNAPSTVIPWGIAPNAHKSYMSIEKKGTDPVSALKKQPPNYSPVFVPAPKDRDVSLLLLQRMGYTGRTGLTDDSRFKAMAIQLAKPTNENPKNLIARFFKWINGDREPAEIEQRFLSFAINSVRQEGRLYDMGLRARSLINLAKQLADILKIPVDHMNLNDKVASLRILVDANTPAERFLRIELIATLGSNPEIGRGAHYFQLPLDSAEYVPPTDPNISEFLIQFHIDNLNQGRLKQLLGDLLADTEQSLHGRLKTKAVQQLPPSDVPTLDETQAVGSADLEPVPHRGNPMKIKTILNLKKGDRAFLDERLGLQMVVIDCVIPNIQVGEKNFLEVRMHYDNATAFEVRRRFPMDDRQVTNLFKLVYRRPQIITSPTKQPVFVMLPPEFQKWTVKIQYLQSFGSTVREALHYLVNLPTYKHTPLKRLVFTNAGELQAGLQVAVRRGPIQFKQKKATLDTELKEGYILHLLRSTSTGLKILAVVGVGLTSGLVWYLLQATHNAALPASPTGPLFAMILWTYTLALSGKALAILLWTSLSALVAGLAFISAHGGASSQPGKPFTFKRCQDIVNSLRTEFPFFDTDIYKILFPKSEDNIDFEVPGILTGAEGRIGLRGQELYIYKKGGPSRSLISMGLGKLKLNFGTGLIIQGGHVVPGTSASEQSLNVPILSNAFLGFAKKNNELCAVVDKSLIIAITNETTPDKRQSLPLLLYSKETMVDPESGLRMLEPDIARFQDLSRILRRKHYEYEPDFYENWSHYTLKAHHPELKQDLEVTFEDQTMQYRQKTPGLVFKATYAEGKTVLEIDGWPVDTYATPNPFVGFDYVPGRGVVNIVTSKYREYLQDLAPHNKLIEAVLPYIITQLEWQQALKSTPEPETPPDTAGISVKEMFKNIEIASWDGVDGFDPKELGQEISTVKSALQPLAIFLGLINTHRTDITTWSGIRDLRNLRIVIARKGSFPDSGPKQALHPFTEPNGKITVLIPQEIIPAVNNMEEDDVLSVIQTFMEQVKVFLQKSGKLPPPPPTIPPSRKGGGGKKIGMMILGAVGLTGWLAWYLLQSAHSALLPATTPKDGRLLSMVFWASLATLLPVAGLALSDKDLPHKTYSYEETQADVLVTLQRIRDNIRHKLWMQPAEVDSILSILDQLIQENEARVKIINSGESNTRMIQTVYGTSDQPDYLIIDANQYMQLPPDAKEYVLLRDALALRAEYKTRYLNHITPVMERLIQLPEPRPSVEIYSNDVKQFLAHDTENSLSVYLPLFEYLTHLDHQDQEHPFNNVSDYLEDLFTRTPSIELKGDYLLMKSALVDDPGAGEYLDPFTFGVSIVQRSIANYQKYEDLWTMATAEGVPSGDDTAFISWAFEWLKNLLYPAPTGEPALQAPIVERHAIADPQATPQMLFDKFGLVLWSSVKGWVGNNLNKLNNVFRETQIEDYINFIDTSDSRELLTKQTGLTEYYILVPKQANGGSDYQDVLVEGNPEEAPVIILPQRVIPYNPDDHEKALKDLVNEIDRQVKILRADRGIAPYHDLNQQPDKKEKKSRSKQRSNRPRGMGDWRFLLPFYDRVYNWTRQRLGNGQARLLAYVFLPTAIESGGLWLMASECLHRLLGVPWGITSESVWIMMLARLIWHFLHLIPHAYWKDFLHMWKYLEWGRLKQELRHALFATDLLTLVGLQVVKAVHPFQAHAWQSAAFLMPQLVINLLVLSLQQRKKTGVEAQAPYAGIFVRPWLAWKWTLLIATLMGSVLGYRYPIIWSDMALAYAWLASSLFAGKYTPQVAYKELSQQWLTLQDHLKNDPYSQEGISNPALRRLGKLLGDFTVYAPSQAENQPLPRSESALLEVLQELAFWVAKNQDLIKMLPPSLRDPGMSRRRAMNQLLRIPWKLIPEEARDQILNGARVTKGRQPFRALFWIKIADVFEGFPGDPFYKPPSRTGGPKSGEGLSRSRGAGNWRFMYPVYDWIADHFGPTIGYKVAPAVFESGGLFLVVRAIGQHSIGYAWNTTLAGMALTMVARLGVHFLHIFPEGTRWWDFFNIGKVLTKENNNKIMTWPLFITDVGTLFDLFLFYIGIGAPNGPDFIFTHLIANFIFPPPIQNRKKAPSKEDPKDLTPQWRLLQDLLRSPAFNPEELTDVRLIELGRGLHQFKLRASQIADNGYDYQVSLSLNETIQSLTQWIATQQEVLRSLPPELMDETAKIKPQSSLPLKIPWHILPEGFRTLIAKNLDTLILMDDQPITFRDKYGFAFLKLFDGLPGDFIVKGEDGGNDPSDEPNIDIPQSYYGTDSRYPGKPPRKNPHQRALREAA